VRSHQLAHLALADMDVEADSVSHPANSASHMCSAEGLLSRRGQSDLVHLVLSDRVGMLHEQYVHIDRKVQDALITPTFFVSHGTWQF
jgi:hypothetical protein